VFLNKQFSQERADELRRAREVQEARDAEAREVEARAALAQLVPEEENPYEPMDGLSFHDFQQVQNLLGNIFPRLSISVGPQGKESSVVIRTGQFS